MSARWEIALTATALRNLEQLPEKAASAIAESFGTIRENPQRVGKPLQRELEGVWVARRGPYRILCRIDDERRLITIQGVGHRADVYRRR